MQKKLLVRKMSFDESISDLSELICEAKLGAETEGGGLALIDNLKDAYASLKWDLSSAEQEGREKDDEIMRVIGERDDFEASLEDAGTNEMRGIQNIKWGADNLLDQQVMEVLAELLEKHGSLPVLRALETINI